MKQIKYFVIITIIFFPIKSQTYCLQGITNRIDKDYSFIDNVYNYCKAKYLSYKHNIPFFYQPFPESHLFCLDQIEENLYSNKKKLCNYLQPIQTNNELEDYLYTNQPIIFECYQNTESPNLFHFSRQYWDFERELKKLLKPATIKPITKKEVSDDAISLGIFIQKNSKKLLGSASFYYPNSTTGWYIFKKNNDWIDEWSLNQYSYHQYIDRVNALVLKKTIYDDYSSPLAYPPLEYYFQVINYILQITEKKLNIDIFIDTKISADLSDFICFLKQNKRILINHSPTNINTTDPINVLTNILQMATYDCYVSSLCPIGLITQIIGSHTKIFLPYHARSYPDQIVIDVIQAFYVNNPQTISIRKMETMLINLQY